MRRRARETGVDVERLTSSDPADWIEPDERVAIVEMVDQAREVWAADPDADAALEHLCPAGRFPARLCENRADAIALTEKLTASFDGRSLAGGSLWRSGGRVTRWRKSTGCPTCVRRPRTGRGGSRRVGSALSGTGGE